MSPALQQIIDLLQRGPMSAKAITAHLNRNHATTQSHLRKLRTAGLIDSALMSQYTVWCMADQLEAVSGALRVEMRAKAAEKALEHSRRKAARARELRKNAAYVESERWAKGMTRRIVPASECKMPAKLGPRWVFDLGAA